MKSMATLVIRLLAVYVFAASAIHFPASGSSLVQTMTQAGIGLPSVILYLLSFVVSALIIPFILWLVAPWLSSRIATDNGAIASASLSMLDVLRLGLILIGLLFLPSASAQFIASIYTLASSSASIDASQRFAYDQGLRQALISSAMQLLVGAVFIGFSTPIARALEKMGCCKKGG